MTRTLLLALKILCSVRASQTRSHDSQVLLADILDNLPARRIADALSHIILLTNTFNILYRSDCGLLCDIFTELKFALYLILSHFITRYHTLPFYQVLSAAHFFMLDELQFYCESLAAGSITKDNVITVYQKAKVHLFVFCVCVCVSLTVLFVC